MFNPALQSGFLHEDVEHVSILVDLAPETMLPATDTDEHLVHEPFVARSRPVPPGTIDGLASTSTWLN